MCGEGRPRKEAGTTRVALGQLRRCGHRVVAMDGVNVVKPSGYSAGKWIWERNLRGRCDDLTTMVANARFAPPWGRSGPATGGRRTRCAGHGRTGSVYDLHLLPTRGIGRRTSAWKTNVSMEKGGAARCRGAPGYSWWTKAALVLAPLGQAVVGSPLWPRLSPNTMCAARCGRQRLR